MTLSERRYEDRYMQVYTTRSVELIQGMEQSTEATPFRMALSAVVKEARKDLFAELREAGTGARFCDQWSRGEYEIDVDFEDWLTAQEEATDGNK